MLLWAVTSSAIDAVSLSESSHGAVDVSTSRAGAVSMLRCLGAPVPDPSFLVLMLVSLPRLM